MLTPVQSLLDDIINSINDLAERGVDSIEQGLKAANPSILGFTDQSDPSTGTLTSASDLANIEIENGAHQLETLLAASIDKNFDIMEVFALRNMLGIPEDLRDWVRLRHYEGLKFDHDPDMPSAESVDMQRRKVRESMRLHRLLLAEHKRTKDTLRQVRTLCTKEYDTPVFKHEETTTESGSGTSGHHAGSLAFLDQTADLREGSSIAPISTTTSFILSQHLALQTSLRELRPQLPALAEKRKRADENEVEKSERRQRFDYMEKQTKKVLENQGLEMGTMGEVVDGEWQGSGRKIRRSEVEDLETIVAAVGGDVSAGEHKEQ